MNVANGPYDLGPQRGTLLVRTTRTGFGSKAGHDLTLEVTRWHGAATVDVDEPGRSTVNLQAEVASMTVRHGSGGVKPLTDGDRVEIEKTMRGKILRSDRYPAITFTSTQVYGDTDSFRIDGDLTIVGEVRPVTVHGHLVDGRARGSATITQSVWGIRPYSAFFGALKLNDDVTVEFDVDLRS